MKPGPALPFGGALLGLLLGALCARFAAGALYTPTNIDPARWNTISPGREDALADPGIGRGVHIAEGALIIRQHAFFRSDLLALRTEGEIGRVELLPDPRSGTFRLNLRGAPGAAPTFLHLAPDHYAIGFNPGPNQPHAGAYQIRSAGGRVTLQDGDQERLLGEGIISAVELMAEADEARIAGLAVFDPADQPLYIEDFRGAPVAPLDLATGALLGALLGLAAGVVVREGRSPAEGALAALLFALPLPLALALPSGAWLYAAERLYLSHTPAWELARIGLALAALPLLTLGLLRSGRLQVRGVAAPDRRPTLLWVALSLLTAAVGARDLGAIGIPVALLGALLLLLPLRTVAAAQLPRLPWLLREAPAFYLVLLLGWPRALLPLSLWRLLLVSANATPLLRRGAREAADHLFLFGLLALVGLETGARDSALATAWDMSRLSGDLASAAPWQDPEPFWEATCGDGAATIAWLGGSSTGGAYQLRGEPAAFFPAQSHAQLCAQGQGLHSYNFGDGGRDTFTMARSLDNILKRAPAKLVVAYIGVNDLLGSQNRLSRKEREAAIQARGDALAGLARLADHSRVLTGLGLLLRPVHAGEGNVPDVPLADAEENLRHIQAVLQARGAQLLLVTELLALDQGPRLSDYDRLLARLAAALPGVRHQTARVLLVGQPDTALLIDRNHLSREGHQRLAAALLPTLQEALHTP